MLTLVTKCCVCLFSVYACTGGGAVADVLGLKGFRPLAINLNSCEEKSPMIRKSCENRVLHFKNQIGRVENSQVEQRVDSWISEILPYFG